MDWDREAEDVTSSQGAHHNMSGPPSRDRVPVRAFIISVLALLVPALGTIAFPGWAVNDVGMLIWLTALVPAFLLTYYRGWWGVTVAIAAGMAALSLSHVVLVAFDLGMPAWQYLLAAVVIYLTVTLGVGAMAELLHREREKARELALTDSLTEIPNRRYASLFLETAFAAAERGHSLTVVLFDLDGFKLRNDRFGHAAGDAALKRVGDVLTHLTRRMNLSARYGGDEFISILANSRLEGAEIFVERILERLRDSRIPGGAVSASIGIAEYEPGMGSPEVLVAAADRALYECKAEGGDGYRIAPRTVGEHDALLGEHREELAERRQEPEEDESGGYSIDKPASKPTRALPDGPDGEGIPGGDGTVLLVEGDADARRAITALLERLGYRVTVCSRGDEALATVEKMSSPPDLLMADLELADMSGFTLVEQVGRSLGEVRVVYISGKAHGEIYWRGAPGSAHEFVRKPFEASDLAERVRRALSASDCSNGVEEADTVDAVSAGVAPASGASAGQRRAGSP